MNRVSRTITGGVIIVLAVLFGVSVGFMGDEGIDYVAILVSVFLLIIGFLILFNKKEDEIERIKK